ncbi:MAG: DUF1659 domain-containing protein [Syntrophomonadaceae bacterium]|jgi:hypothetical protein|nr:DUF1659 domain-containing protein [Syntrophomonadaceae bacterium]
MAVNATTISTDLVLVMDGGIGAGGKQLFVNRSFKRVKPEASNDNIYAIAQELLDLQDKNNIAVQRRDIVELINQ